MYNYPVYNQTKIHLLNLKMFCFEVIDFTLSAYPRNLFLRLGLMYHSIFYASVHNSLWIDTNQLIRLLLSATSADSLTMKIHSNIWKISFSLKLFCGQVTSRKIFFLFFVFFFVLFFFLKLLLID